MAKTYKRTVTFPGDLQVVVNYEVGTSISMGVGSKTVKLLLGEEGGIILIDDATGHPVAGENKGNLSEK